MAYVYRHIRLDKNEPFYIGIGSDNLYKRAFDKKSSRRNKIWNDIVNKTDYRVDILMDDLTWEEACEKEKEFINLYGRINLKNGCLSNLTDGGDGSLGYVPSEKNIEKLRIRMTGENNPFYGKKHTPETTELIRLKKIGKTAHNKGIPMTDKQKNLLSKVKKGCKAWNKGIPRTNEEKLKISESRKMKNIPAWNKGKFGVNGNGLGKIVLNLENGIFYESCKEASIAYNKTHSTLKARLNGDMKNNTSFIYA